MIDKVYNVPCHVEDGKYYIDQSYLKIILELEAKTKDIDSFPEAIKYDLSTVEFKKRVVQLWSSCVSHESMPWKNPSNVIGEALRTDFCFDPYLLQIHYDEIVQLIEQLTNAKHYLDLMYLNDGRIWTSLHQTLTMIMSLGNALNLISFKKNLLDWNMEDCNNPEIEFNLKRTRQK